MFTHCCGHATIVAWRQPLFGSIERLPAPARLDGLDFESPASPARHNLSAIEREFLRGFASHHRMTQLICRHASPRIAKRNSKRIPAAADRSIGPRAMRAPKVTTPDIDRIRSDRVIFVRPALFCACFRHARMRTTTCAQSVDQSFICQTKQRRTQFVAEVLIAVEIDRCAEAAVAEMPFASPYCLYRAQNRRVRVQSRTRLAVSSSMRVRESASRSSRAHHLTIPKIRGGRL